MKAGLKNYIIDAIDATGYDLKQQPRNNEEKLQFLFDTFKSEYGFNIERYGVQGAFKEWIQGLPSSFGVDYTYCDIIAVSKVIRPSKYSDNKLCATWFDFIATNVFKLFREYKIAGCSVPVSEIKYFAEKNGSYFFSRDTMRFFKDKVSDFYAYKDALGNCYIESKKRPACWLFNYETGNFQHISNKAV